MYSRDVGTVVVGTFFFSILILYSSFKTRMATEKE
jgi:hypothetical protein